MNECTCFRKGLDLYSPVGMTTTTTTATLSRTQERAELQQLNDRFASYVHHVRQLAERSQHVDSSVLLQSTRSLEAEMHHLKDLYEQELEKLRKELEVCSGERSSLHVQMNKQLQCSSELQDRLSVEVDRSAKLQDEVGGYQSRVSGLEAELQSQRLAAGRPLADLDRLQRTLENLTREMDTWKHRYEHEQIARQEAENKVQQMIQKSDFNDKVNGERVGELSSRVQSSSATILSLEAKVRDLSKADVSVSDLLKQVRDSAEAELRKFQLETEEHYNRNLTALKAQLDSEAKTVEELTTERTQLRGSVGELLAKIRSLEGQVANLDHQKHTLEDMVAVERNRAVDGARTLESKLREVQDLLVVKMREATMARENTLPLKAEIEALKVLLEEEEKRLRVPLGITTTSCVLSAVPPAPLLTMSYDNMVTTATTPATSLALTSQALPAVSTFCTQHGVTSSSVGVTGSPVGVTGSSVGVTGQQTVSFADPKPLTLTSAPLTQTGLSEPLLTSGGGCGDVQGMALTLGEGAINVSSGEADMDPPMYGFHNTTPLAKYSYEDSPGLSRLAMEPSPYMAAVVRSMSAPAHGHRNLPFAPGDVGQGYSYLDVRSNDLQRDVLQGRPKTTPMRSNRSLAAQYHDYTVSTSSAIGDLKIFEVHPDGKYVRLLNEGVQEIEFGGYMLQQNVGGHPVAVFRFPPRTKFDPDSTVAVYAGCSDHKLHSPPQDFVWKEQQKWGTGPECTTILCRPNGQEEMDEGMDEGMNEGMDEGMDEGMKEQQKCGMGQVPAVAWTTAAHRFTRDAFQDGQIEADDDATKADDDKQTYDQLDDETLTEISVNVNEPKSEPVYLRREKQQPPSLQANKHPHGNAVNVPVHPHMGQSRPLCYGNDNSSNNRQSRSQSTRPDPVPGQPYAGAAAQKMGSAPLRKLVPGVRTQPSPGIRVSGKAQESGPGDGNEVPSPFMKPHARFQSGLDQVQSQYHKEFLPPMPRPPLFSAW
ncbi:hypothetical protein ACOMHN_026459 [Nucella lapillus]